MAAEACASGTLTHAEQQQAAADAHKLAGVLGTFGLNEGTELAREAESSLREARRMASPPLHRRLAQIARATPHSMHRKPDKCLSECFNALTSNYTHIW